MSGPAGGKGSGGRHGEAQTPRPRATVSPRAPVAAIRDRLPAGAVTAFGPRMHVSMVRSGVVDLTGSAGRLRVRAGQIVVVPPGHGGHVRAVTDADSFVVIFDERFVADVLRWADPAGGAWCGWPGLAGSTMTRVQLGAEAAARFEQRFRKTIGAVRRDRPLRAVSAAIRLLSRVEPLVTGDRPGGEDRPVPLRREVAEARRLLTEDPAHPWTVRELARRVGLSSSALTRAFRAGLGVTPGAYLREVRLARFAALLTDTRLGVAEAAWQVGWASPSHARELTTRRYGVSPRVLRERGGVGVGEASG